ncbi:F0F1 ATP synthase subunit B [Aliifodinibius sp. S!AR15-10]|uniref:F0F1 ATP synthase subunit B n=1 Tax=Aliifodinibius sp. S!AR15-10 TaxID=2950437 RepID=UPI00285B4267|nr:F0F1 ATP synthase subunit B [Aliifodinibius sp. S!AR15-10]MDR8391123.1 F0F1 ATP synthase subunit B [Aliifodinibius sp. S!AR15-10]
MSLSLLLAAGEEGGGAILNFSSGFAIWVAITLIIFLVAMAKYAVPLIMEALSEREDRIKESLESAEKALERAEQISKDNEKALREAEQKAQKIRKEAIEEAEMLRSERIEKAKEEAAHILEQARETIEQEKKRAMLELRDEVARLAVKSASMIIEAELDDEKNSKLVNNYIEDISKN